MKMQGEKENELYGQRIREWIQINCGMAYPDEKKELLLHRMLRVCEKHQLDDLKTLANVLEDESSFDVRLAVMHAASINHTYFFREPKALNYFETQILPRLPDSGTRIWSAAASSGDEAYTIAMIAAQARGMQWATRKLAILGTDISDVVLKQAESAMYTGMHLEYTPSDILENYFESVGMGQYRVIEALRDICTFRRMNLTNIPYPFKNRFHAIFCRNVLYYFDVEQQKKVVNALYDVTEPGGFLITSVTMSLRNLDSRWISLESGIHYKKG